MRLAKNQKGSVLISTAIISVLMFAVIFHLCNSTAQTTKNTVRQVARKKAMVNAEAGLQSALQFLRSPKAAQLEAGVPFLLGSVHQNTTYYLSMTRHPIETSEISVVSTGYYLLGDRSDFTDETLKGQMASVQAKVTLRSVAEYFAATTDNLEIGYGSDIGTGFVYSRNLKFSEGTTLPKTILKGADYSATISPANYLNYVTFLSTPQPRKLAVEPTLPLLDESMRQLYQTMAEEDVLLANTPLYGDVSAPTQNAYRVYYAPGDVHLGIAGSSCTIAEPFLIYSAGNIYIDNIVEAKLNSGAWVALLAEGNIYISPQAPLIMSVEATMVTNGFVEAQGVARTLGTFRLKGGIVAGEEIKFGHVYNKQRTFIFQAPLTSLPLPFATILSSYKVNVGVHNQ